MKRFLTIALAAASIGLFAGTASAAVATYNTGDAANGIGNSRHNLGSFGEHVIFGANYNTVSGNMKGTTEICIFCHTPHHANTANETAPLWNKNRGATTYTAYGTTIGGSTIANSDIGSTTLACLGCHDGTTQFDNIVNSPGKAGVNGTVGSGADGTAIGSGNAGWSVFENGATVSDFMTSTRLNIGVNLSNDHPVSVAYPAVAAGSTGIASLRPTSTVISTIDLLDGLSASATTYDGGNLTKNYWAVKGFVNGAAKISDLLRGTGNRVECSSCHDPHFNNKSWNEIDVTYSITPGGDDMESNGLFLRRVGGNTGSGLCRTCHNK